MVLCNPLYLPLDCAMIVPGGMGMVLNRSVTATVYIVKENRVLLHMHKKYNTWFPVGGHLEPNEFPHEAALREVLEETGLSVKLLQTENVGEFDAPRVQRVPLPFLTYYEGIGHEEEFYDFIFIATTTQENPHPATGESSAFRWFSEEELQSDESLKPHIRSTAVQVLQNAHRYM